MSKIGVVTVTYNSATVLADFFRCLQRQSDPDFVVYVVDNQSSDGSAESSEQLCRQYELNYRVIRNPTNLGIACGNNQGIRMALADGCDPILIANNDIEFPDDTFARVRDFGRSHPGELLAPKVVFHEDVQQIWYAGGDFSRFRGVPGTRGHRQPDRPEFSVPGYTRGAPTCFLVVPAEVFTRVGIMDEDFFVYLDDSDFILRVLNGGYRVMYSPEPVIRHKVSVSTGGKDSPFTIHQMAKNTILFLYKNYSFPIAALYLLIYLGRCSLHLFRYRGVQLTRLFQGLRDGFVFVAQHRTTAKRNIPPI